MDEMNLISLFNSSLKQLNYRLAINFVTSSAEQGYEIKSIIFSIAETFPKYRIPMYSFSTQHCQLSKYICQIKLSRWTYLIPLNLNLNYIIYVNCKF